MRKYVTHIVTFKLSDFQEPTFLKLKAFANKFEVKTMKINWEGSNDSYMHVFIDTTNVSKLEEAKNSIR